MNMRMWVPTANGAAAAATPDFGSDFGNTFAPSEPPAPAPALDVDLSQDNAPVPVPAPLPVVTEDFMADFNAEQDTALPPAADASVSPASVAQDNLMDFDLDGLNFEPPAPAPAAETAAVPAPADDMGLDFGLDLPASAAATPLPAAEPAEVTDPLDLDLAGFDIPEVPALTEPPKEEPAPLDFDTSLELPEEVSAAAAAPAPAPAEFDLSGIDLDLDSTLGGNAFAADTPAAGEPLSAHHMEMDTKLDLAVAYQEIGDKEGARELLDEVIRGGNPEQVGKANAMKAQLA
ncbi:hypothetical protein E4L98_18600 [Duganella callida]|uniref:Pilus assembly protein FimV n=2 Tax=Duganella callida TaxID=2561932 RepID=A0A4Y9S9I3_9BURK|nr:hypothetical protein E4L98_18600 [Duganella callida]